MAVLPSASELWQGFGHARFHPVCIHQNSESAHRFMPGQDTFDWAPCKLGREFGEPHFCRIMTYEQAASITDPSQILGIEEMDPLERASALAVINFCPFNRFESVDPQEFNKAQRMMKEWRKRQPKNFR